MLFLWTALCLAVIIALAIVFSLLLGKDVRLDQAAKLIELSRSMAERGDYEQANDVLNKAKELLYGKEQKGENHGS